MNRRDFLKGCLAAGVGVGLTRSSLGRIAGASGIYAGEPSVTEGGIPPDIVAVRNGEPAAMFDRGIAAMGGMGRFVQRGQTVAIKPNASWDATVQMAGNTNPELVNRIARHCMEAGARRVLVFDHAIEHWQRCLEASGIGAAVKDAGAILAPAEAERYYHSQKLDGKTLREVKVHEAVLEADVLISVPILKHHGGAGITGGIKNFMGAVWDRRTYHARGLSQCIADFLLVRKPDLTVIDAYRILTRFSGAI